MRCENGAEEKEKRHLALKRELGSLQPADIQRLEGKGRRL